LSVSPSVDIEARERDDATINNQCQHCIQYMKVKNRISVIERSTLWRTVQGSCPSNINKDRLSRKNAHETPFSRKSNRVPLKDSVSPQFGFSFNFRLDIRSSALIYHKRSGTTCRIAQARFTLTLHSRTTAFQNRPCETSVGS
jgi:hypothetical protein